MEEHIEKLNQLTKEVLALFKTDVLPLVDIAHFKSSMEVNYEMEAGTCEIMHVFNNGVTGILYAVMSPNSQMKIHEHETSNETVVCVKGEFIHVVEEMILTLKPGQSVLITRGVKHIAKSIIGCEVIGITVPPSPGYPKDEEND